MLKARKICRGVGRPLKFNHGLGLEGKVLKEYQRFLLVDFGIYKECLLKVDFRKDWEYV